MNDFFLYLIKSSVWIIIFGAIYHLFLRKEKFFTFNRIFLLSGILASIFFPFLEYRYTVEILSSVWETTTEIPTINFGQSAQPTISWKTILLISYCTISLCLCIRNIVGIHNLNSLLNKGKKLNYSDKKVIDIPSYQHSFAFLNKIILGNSERRSSLENELIIEHENAHIIQKHWIDLSLVQLLSVLQWFNPFIWLYSRSIKENLEYLADEEVLKKGISPVIYQAVLINSTLNHSVFNLTSSFTSNKFKRIKMMKKNASKPIKKFSALLLVPALGLFLWAFAEPEYKIVKKEPSSSVNKKTEVTAANDDSIQKKTKRDYKEVGKHGKTTQTKETKDKATVQFVPPFVKDTVAQYSKREKKESKNKKTIRFVPPFVKDTVPEDNSSRNNPQKGEPIIVYNGEEISKEEYESIQKNTTKGKILFTIIKPEKAIQEYGEKGKNGVILLSTDKESSKSDKKILCILDGEEFAYKSITELEKDMEKYGDSIVEVTVLKEAEALKPYGQKGENGVIIINTKEGK